MPMTRKCIITTLQEETDSFLDRLDEASNRFPQLTSCVFAYTWGTSFAAQVHRTFHSQAYEMACLYYNMAAICSAMARNVSWLTAVNYDHNAKEAFDLIQAATYMKKCRLSMSMVTCTCRSSWRI